MSNISHTSYICIRETHRDLKRDTSLIMETNANQYAMAESLPFVLGKFTLDVPI